MLKLVCKCSSSINGFRPLRHVFSATSYSSIPTKQQQPEELPSSFLPNFFVENLGFSERQSLPFSARIAASWRADAVNTRRQRSFFASTSSLGHLLSNVRLLEKDYGISTDIIRSQVVRNEGAFFRNSELFRKILMEVEHKWGISPSSGMFLYGVHIFGSLSTDLIETKIRLFKSFGWNQSHIMTIINKFPHCLIISEARLGKSLEFLMNEMGYEPAFLACRPALFTCSLETRLLPRQKVLVGLREKGLIATDCSLCNVAKLTESKFFHKFVQPFKDDLPDLYQEYFAIRGSQTNKMEIGAA